MSERHAPNWLEKMGFDKKENLPVPPLWYIEARDNHLPKEEIRDVARIRMEHDLLEAGARIGKATEVGKVTDTVIDLMLGFYDGIYDGFKKEQRAITKAVRDILLREGKSDDVHAGTEYEGKTYWEMVKEEWKKNPKVNDTKQNAFMQKGAGRLMDDAFASYVKLMTIDTVTDANNFADPKDLKKATHAELASDRLIDFTYRYYEKLQEDFGLKPKEAEFVVGRTIRCSIDAFFAPMGHIIPSVPGVDSDALNAPRPPRWR